MPQSGGVRKNGGKFFGTTNEIIIVYKKPLQRVSQLVKR